jgi:hypothetical protein
MPYRPASRPVARPNTPGRLVDPTTVIITSLNDGDAQLIG